MNSRSACSKINQHGCWVGPSTMRAWSGPFRSGLAQKDKLGRYRPNQKLLGSAQPTYLILYYIIILYLKKTKKNSKKFQKSFQKNCDFFKYFLPILHNIGLYIYIVKYKSGIKIPGFFQNISRKISKNF